MTDSRKDLLSAFSLKTVDQKVERPKGVVTGSAQHYLFRADEDRPFRHGVIGKYHYPGEGDYWAAYLSLAEKDSDFYDDMHIRGQAPSTICCPGMMHRMPQKIKRIAHEIFPENMQYVGFDWFLTEQPTLEQLERGMQNLVNLLDDLNWSADNDSVVS